METITEQRHEHLTEEENQNSAQIRTVDATLYEKVLTTKMDLRMINGKWSITCFVKIGSMMNNLKFLWICLTLQHRN